MSVPTRGEVFAKMLDHAREFQSCASMMAHLHNTESNDADKTLARGWLMVEELLRRLIHKITLLGQGKLN